MTVAIVDMKKISFNYGFGKNRTVEVCNSIYDQLVYIAIENTPQFAAIHA